MCFFFLCAAWYTPPARRLFVLDCNWRIDPTKELGYDETYPDFEGLGSRASVLARNRRLRAVTRALGHAERRLLGPCFQADSKEASFVLRHSLCSCYILRLIATFAMIPSVRKIRQAQYPAVTYFATGASGVWGPRSLVDTRNILLILFRLCHGVHRCLTACKPSGCPLCRKKFSNSHVTKLRTTSVEDSGSEGIICSPISATTSTSSRRSNERRDSLRGKGFDDRVAAHIKETGEMIKEVTERVYLQHAIEATLRAKLAEVELERDTLSQ